MALFRRGDGHHRGDDHDNRWTDESGWTTDRMSDGTIFRWRVRMERIGSILPEYKEALEAVAREEGYTYREYVAWAANLTDARMNDTRDRIRNGLASPREAALYRCWLGARLAVHEVQYRLEVRPGKFIWSGR
ncbi:hypothetical protein QR97_12445 [Streptomyces sp. PBH53]|uniref:hypothetical protein n=1 Tax=Streptomyces TaxID=1883 RepID=UPI00065583A6|nr:hypothetical protein [Streptomyces sp. PBH53]AKN70533.1 hypothetical protein QR97_12445 [Streptomyces sp. PBH53]